MSYQEDIENIFNLRTIIEKEIEDIDKKDLYQYIYKNKSLGFLFSYLNTLIEREIGDYSVENRLKIIDYLFTCIFKEFEKSLKIQIFDKCLKLYYKKDPKFMSGYNASEAQKVFICMSNEELYFWEYYLEKSVKVLTIKK